MFFDDFISFVVPLIGLLILATALKLVSFTIGSNSSSSASFEERLIYETTDVMQKIFYPDGMSRNDSRELLKIVRAYYPDYLGLCTQLEGTPSGNTFLLYSMFRYLLLIMAHDETQPTHNQSVDRLLDVFQNALTRVATQECKKNHSCSDPQCGSDFEVTFGQWLQREFDEVRSEYTPTTTLEA